MNRLELARLRVGSVCFGGTRTAKHTQHAAHLAVECDRKVIAVCAAPREFQACIHTWIALHAARCDAHPTVVMVARMKYHVVGMLVKPPRAVIGQCPLTEPFGQSARAVKPPRLAGC
jgi:hypothetical protein